MKILITNDDGIFSAGIEALWRALVEFADVTIAAPDRERSAMSQAITVAQPILVDRYELDHPRVTAWKVGGSYDIVPGLNAHASFAQFNTSSNAVYSAGNATHKASETDVDITYKPASIKNLELKLRAIYARDFVANAGGQDFNEYRVIANYNF